MFQMMFHTQVKMSKSTMEIIGSENRVKNEWKLKQKSKKCHIMFHFREFRKIPYLELRIQVWQKFLLSGPDCQDFHFWGEIWNILLVPENVPLLGPFLISSSLNNAQPCHQPARNIRGLLQLLSLRNILSFAESLWQQSGLKAQSSRSHKPR